MVTISNKHSEIDIDDHEIQNFLFIFNLLIEAESDKISNGEDAEDKIRDILITIAAKSLQILHNNIDSLKIPDIIDSALKKLKSFNVKDKKDGTNKSYSENSSRSQDHLVKGEEDNQDKELGLKTLKEEFVVEALK